MQFGNSKRYLSFYHCQTLDIRLWELLLEMIRVVADLFKINADELLGKMLTDPVAEQKLTPMLGNCLQEAG
jgi:hypothetical protein